MGLSWNQIKVSAYKKAQQSTPSCATHKHCKGIAHPTSSIAMGLFRRRKGVEDQDGSTSQTQGVSYEPNEEQTEQVQEVMKDNLELMKEVVMRIREDPDFASNIYSECPRLQHLLVQYPDLRPIFEDPKLVRINFEQVYRDAGGVLPEDEEKKKSWLVWIVNSPIFKVLKLVLFVKKIVTCIAGGGFAIISGCFMGCCFEDALEEWDADDIDFDGEGTDAAREALNKAADRMEDPEVQEQMQALLEDPDNLQEAIENDPELKALRDSSPLCEELMSDPETMRVLTDPDNLRALGEAPSLIQADFIDPQGFMPTDLETGGFEGFGDGIYDAFDGGDGMDFADTDADFDVDGDADVDDGFDAGELEGEEEEDGGWWEDAEMEEQDADNDAADGKAEAADAKADAADGKGDAARSQDDQANAKQAKQARRNRAAEESGQNNGRAGGIMATIGATATSLIATQLVGNFFDATGAGDLLGGGGGGGMDGGGGGITGNVSEFADDAGNVLDDDVAGVAENIKDEVDEKANEKDGENDNLDTNEEGKKNAAVAAAAGTAGGGAAIAGSRGKPTGDEEEGGEQGEEFEDEAEPQEEKRKGRFAFIGNLASAISTAAKEHVATALLGDDFGEALVERMGGEKEDEDDNKDKKEGEQQEKETGKSRTTFLGREKNKVV